MALPSLLYYLAGYTVTNIAAFAVTTALPDHRDLGSYRGLASSHPWLAGSLVVALLGLVGTPPTAVFIGKLTTATAAWDGGQAWLAVVVFVNSLASLFYYLRWIIPSYRIGERDSSAPRRFAPAPWSTRIAVTASMSTILLGVAAGAVWTVVDGMLAR
jgi:NADH-quinone oxidoreductase subunit N